jgi:lipopolysaccharide transport system ATP-binding protein
VDFADIGEFMNQPVRTYSSGMYVRLAFSVAVSVDPEILVVDEALSVGDEMFQRKCFSRIHQLREKGATVLFVSHAPRAIIELCNRAFLLDRGEAIIGGWPRFVISRYQHLLAAPPHKYAEVREQIRLAKPGGESTGGALSYEVNGDSQNPININAGEAFVPLPFLDPALVPENSLSYASLGAEIINPRITTLEGEQVNTLVARDTYSYAYEVVFHFNATSVTLAMLINTQTGYPLGGSFHAPRTDPIPLIKRGQVVTAQFRFRCLLLPGVYCMNSGVLGVVDGNEVYLDRRIDLINFRVLPAAPLQAHGPVDFLIDATVRLSDAEVDPEMASLGG